MPMSFRVLRDDERAKPGDPAQLLAVLRAIESTIRKGDVVVMASEGEPAPVGMIGGFVAQQYRNLGVAGAIVDGYIRDVVELRERGLPVFARGGAPAKLGGRVTLTALGQPVRFRGIDVGPDDYVAADADGIVVIPAAAVANRALVDWLRVMKADEQRCMGLLEQGTPYSKAIRVISAYKLG
jgi:regulator of RNase E activity RraA